jgi:hypothetical protein
VTPPKKPALGNMRRPGGYRDTIVEAICPVCIATAYIDLHGTLFCRACGERGLEAQLIVIATVNDR